LSVITSESSSAADSAFETDDNHKKSLQRQAVMTLIQAAILQIMIERNSVSVFNNKQESIIITNINTEMIIKTTDLLLRANSILIKISDIKMKNINFDHNQNLK